MPGNEAAGSTLWTIVFSFVGQKYGVWRGVSGAEETGEAGRSQHVPSF